MKGNPLRAVILAVGSELLLGGRVESNSLFLAEILADCGIEVRKKIAVGDHQADIRAALRASFKHADVIVVTGGLGSTLDDCTREAIAEVCHRPLMRRRRAYQILKERVHSRGRIVTPLIAQQALIPTGATILHNAVGTAPGFYFQEKGSVICVLPGVPSEAKAMMIAQMQPVLRRICKGTRRLWSHAFHTYGLSELDVQAQLGPILKRAGQEQIGLLPSPKGVTVTVSGWVLDHVKSSTKAPHPILSEWNHLIDQMRECLGSWLFAEGEQSMEEIVGECLRRRHWNLAVAESCTGGLIAHRLTEVSGSSDYVDRSVVTYSNASKEALLGVSGKLLQRHGAVSLSVAKAMATGIKNRSHVDVGLSVTGIAGPGGGTVKKPVGLVYMAIDGPLGCHAQRCQFWGTRTEIKLRSSQAALDLIRRYAVNALSARL